MSAPTPEQQPVTVTVQAPAQQSPPPGYVMLSPKDMYDDIQAIKSAVVALAGLPDRVTKLEESVDWLKARVWLMTGASSLASAAIGAFASGAIH